LEALGTQLLAWVNNSFETIGQEKYFKELVSASILFSLYTDPQLRFHTKEVELSIRLALWLWLNDDVLEQATTNKIELRALKLYTDQILSIFTDKYDNIPKPEFQAVLGYPTFRDLFYWLLEWHNVSRGFLPEYEYLVKNFANSLTSYFTALRWSSVDQIDGRYSVESFKTYRKAVAFMDGTANGVALINGVKLPNEMLNCVTMKRLLEVANVFGGFANDLLGMKKEFANEERDNLIVFMVLEKKIPLPVAVAQVSELLSSELSDYVLLKQVILQEFDYDENLVKYLDILDSLIDGHNVIYAGSTRHLAVGSVTLTRQ